MSSISKSKKIGGERRQKRVRKKVRGTPQHPRLCVYKSLKHIYAQIIDDISGRSITGASSLNPELEKMLEKGENKLKVSKKVGLYLAKLVKEKGSDAAVKELESAIETSTKAGKKKNALTLAMYQAMADAVNRAVADAAVRALLITGQPGVFTSGNDLVLREYKRLLAADIPKS